MISKRCPKCDRTKPVSAFNVDRHRPDGRTSWCRECHHGRVQVVAHVEEGLAHALRTLARSRGLTVRQAVVDAIALYIAEGIVDVALGPSWDRRAT